MEELLKKYNEYKKELNYLGYMNFVISFDCVTDCPTNDRKRSYEVQEELMNRMYKIILSEDYFKTVESLFNSKDKLTEVQRLDIEKEYEDLTKTNKIPHDELMAHIENINNSGMLWQEARVTKDFSKFEVELKKLVKYYRNLMKWFETDSIKGFDVILNEMEKGYSEEKYDKFFDVIESELVPYVKEILACPKPYNPKLDTLTFSIDKQKNLTEKIRKIMEYDNSVGCIRETMHPFTNWANHNDVRITTSYDEKLLFSNLYSVMHEIGHALFQIHMDPIYDDTNVFNMVTCITHESQSRFYENYLGRSKSFVKWLYPVLLELFPNEFEGITFTDLYNYINSVQAQFKRTEADELTYPLHILVRYKVEKMLFHNEIEVEDIEEIFASLMESYLGIRPKNKDEGCYQDVHWSSDFGYFPTYAVGSAYGAQFMEAMKKDIDVDKCLENGSFKEINIWLTDKIHKYSGTRANDEVVKSVCNEEFDPHKYIKYLKNKYKEIYNV